MLTPPDRQRIPVYDICSLAPHGYLANAPGVLMGRPFQSLVIGFYLGRVAGATFFVACMYFALRLVQGRFDRY